jgi:uncharacterized membrane protein
MTGRWLALDRLRTSAIALMIQGHTFSALLDPSALNKGFERVHSLLHGLTAPMFLLGAGLAFGITSYPRYQRQRLDDALFKARMRRCALLLTVGYALQLPGGSPFAIFNASDAQRALLLRVGPLHLIAVTLCAAQLLMRAIPSPRLHALALSTLGLAIAAATPAIWKGGYSAQLGQGLGNWLDHHHGSQFSLFPWASFMLLGAGIGGLISAIEERRRGPVLLAAGALLAGGAYALFAFEMAGFEPHWFWYTNPVYVAFRLGVVLLLLGALHRRSDCTPRAAQTKPGLLAVVTRHSLAAYVAHLLLLYGTPLTPNLARRFAQRLTLPESCFVVVAVTLLTLGVVYLLELRERAKESDARWQSAPERERATIAFRSM